MTPSSSINPTKPSSKYLSKMYSCELPENYTPEDAEAAQLAYLYGGECSLEHLLNFRTTCLEPLSECLIVLYDNIHLLQRQVFPVTCFITFIENKDCAGIEVTKRLCEARHNFYVNILYLVGDIPVESSQAVQKQYFSTLSVLLGFKSCYVVFENRELWGLERNRTGFHIEGDSSLLSLCRKEQLDITQVNAIKATRNGDARDNEFFKDDRVLSFSNDALFHPFFYTKEPVHLPFILQGALSFITGFDPSLRLSKATIGNNAYAINQLYECLYPLLLNPTIKANFCAFVRNVVEQDRTKMVYDEKTNCDDSACYTLFHLLLKLGKGVFNSSFVSKIDNSVFPTFCFYYIPRLMEISLFRLMGDLKEDYNKENTYDLLAFEHAALLEYYEFFFLVIRERQVEFYTPLLDALLGQGTHSESITIEKIRVFVNEGTGVIPFTPKEKKASAISDILHDSSFISTLLSVYVIHVNKQCRSAMTLLNATFCYRNAYTLDALCVLYKMNPGFTPALVSRLVGLYSLKDDSNVYDFRHKLHDLLREHALDTNRETLRMITFCISGMEEKISAIFDFIQEINEYTKKLEALKRLLEQSDEPTLSEDEESVSLYPSRNLDVFASMTEQQLVEFLRMKTDDVEQVKEDIQNQIKYRSSAWKTAVYKKIKINKVRKERLKKRLLSSAVYLDGLLLFIKSQTVHSKRLFLNKTVFFRLCSVINSALNLLVGERSKTIKIANKQEYELNPKQILMNVAQIVVNLLRGNDKLIINSGLDAELVEKTIELCTAKSILRESELLELVEIKDILKTRENQAEQVNLDDVPEEFIDPLTFMLMVNPVTMKTSNITIDLTTFKQIMLNDQLDPFSRRPIDESLIVENSELKKKIEDYIKQSKNNK